jgi:hypothetical protein
VLFRCSSGPFRLSFASLFELEVGRADRNDVAISKDLLLDAARIDEHTVLAAPVNDSGVFIIRNDDCMTSTDEGGLKLNVIMSSPTDSEPVFE